NIFCSFVDSDFIKIIKKGLDMDKNEFLNALAEILMVDINDLKEEAELNSFDDFDSVAILEISILFEKKLDIEVFPIEIKKMKQIKDLLKLGKFI
ncbi:acyl carrier protein, partial [Campylobacter coli]|nr:acyl carrier protein [Campylobacter coli]EAL5208996.1 acyl carrier protein [Campylobacter coli]